MYQLNIFIQYITDIMLKNKLIALINFIDWNLLFYDGILKEKNELDFFPKLFMILIIYIYINWYYSVSSNKKSFLKRQLIWKE